MADAASFHGGRVSNNLHLSTCVSKFGKLILKLCVQNHGGQNCTGRGYFIHLFGVNPLNAELNPICCLLALLGAHHFLHVSRIRVKSLTLRLLMSYIYGAPILDVSRSHTMTHHSR